MDIDLDTEQSKRMLNAVFKAKDVCAKVSLWMLHLYDVEDDAELCCYLPELKFEMEKYYSSADFDITPNTTKHCMIELFAAAGIRMEVDNKVALTIDDMIYILRTQPTFSMCEPESDSDDNGLCRTGDVVYVDQLPVWVSGA
jgi:hypothetical protein